MDGRIDIYKWLVLVVIVMTVILSACSNNNIQESIPEKTEELSESFSEAITEKHTDFEIKENVTMYYDLEEMVMKGEKIDRADDAEYNLNNLIPVNIYEQTGVKLYAYEYEYEVDAGFAYTDYKFLLEYDGHYQAFDHGIGGMFQYESQEALYAREFELGYEYDFDNDNRLEFVEFVSYTYGTSSADAEIIIFDYNKDSNEYEAYCINADDFENLTDDCLKEFFDKYYSSYDINEYGQYIFDNGISVTCGSNASAYMNDESIIEVSTIVSGEIRDEDNFGYDVGSIIFEVNYIGDGQFSVKASRYKEIKSIMDPNAW